MGRGGCKVERPGDPGGPGMGRGGVGKWVEAQEGLQWEGGPGGS